MRRANHKPLLAALLTIAALSAVATEVAAHAEEQHAGVIDEVSQFYAQHSGLIKTLGGAALAIALAKMKENATRG